MKKILVVLMPALLMGCDQELDLLLSVPALGLWLFGATVSRSHRTDAGGDGVKDLAKRLASIPKAAERKAYEMGWDCAKNGANTTNCHFALFARPELTKAWERGKREATDG